MSSGWGLGISLFVSKFFSHEADVQPRFQTTALFCHLHLEGVCLLSCRFFFSFYLRNVAYQSQYSIVFTEMCFGEMPSFCVEKSRRQPHGTHCCDWWKDVHYITLSSLWGPLGGICLLALEVVCFSCTVGLLLSLSLSSWSSFSLHKSRRA